jgi:hypothetical protein
VCRLHSKGFPFLIDLDASGLSTIGPTSSPEGGVSPPQPSATWMAHHASTSPERGFSSSASEAREARFRPLSRGVSLGAPDGFCVHAWFDGG